MLSSGPKIFSSHGKLPPVIQRKRRHPQDGNHLRSYRGGGLAERPGVLARERKRVVEKGEKGKL